MFRKHFYTFGGKNFLQSEGGPIGLRGTCAVARVIMQIFDRKWISFLEGMGVRGHHQQLLVVRRECQAL